MIAFGLLAGGGLHLLVSVALTWWGARVGRARGGLWRHLVWLPIAGYAALTIGVAGTVLGMIHAFQAVAGADPAQKTALLADGIAVAMNGTAFGIVGAGVLDLVALVGCALGTLMPAAPEPPR